MGGVKGQGHWCPEFEATRSERRWGERPATQEFVDNEELLEGPICVTEITLVHLKLGLAGRKEILWGQENGWEVIGVGQGLEGYVGFPSLSFSIALVLDSISWTTCFEDLVSGFPAKNLPADLALHEMLVFLLSSSDRDLSPVINFHGPSM